MSHLSLIARSSMWRSLMLFLETESHFLNSEVIVPSVAVIDGITFRFIFHISVSSFSDDIFLISQSVLISDSAICLVDWPVFFCLSG